MPSHKWTDNEKALLIKEMMANEYIKPADIRKKYFQHLTNEQVRSKMAHIRKNWKSQEDNVSHFVMAGINKAKKDLK